MQKNMNISKELKAKYNEPQTLFVLSSFPEQGGEVAAHNAVARYSHLLLSHFPQSKKIVVISEKFGADDTPYELTSNILVVPSYHLGSVSLSLQILRTIMSFPSVTDLMVQFEFSIFGGKIALPGLVLALSTTRARGMHITFMFHQVIRDLGHLSGHLGIAKNGIAKHFLNWSMARFYQVIGLISNTVIVHDSALKDQLDGVIPSDKIVIIPHGCGDTAYLSPKLRNVYRRKFGFKKNDLVVLAYGYLSWYKGTDWIIKTVGEIAKKYPQRNIVLLLPGSQSPTLKGTKAYSHYKRTLNRLLKTYAAMVVTPGFIPENEVAGIFAASDVAVFPYRIKMSASGALSVAWQYGKRILVSKEFAKNYDELDARTILEGHDVSVGQITFQMNQNSFEQALFELFDKPGAGYKVARASRAIARSRSWSNVAHLYNQVCTSNAQAPVVKPVYQYVQTH